MVFNGTFQIYSSKNLVLVMPSLALALSYIPPDLQQALLSLALTFHGLVLEIHMIIYKNVYLIPNSNQKLTSYLSIKVGVCGGSKPTFNFTIIQFYPLKCNWREGFQMKENDSFKKFKKKFHKRINKIFYWKNWETTQLEFSKSRRNWLGLFF